MPDSDKKRFKRTYRRNFLKYGAAGGIGLLAGCTGGDGDGGDGGDTNTPTEGGTDGTGTGSDGGGGSDGRHDATLKVWRAGTEVISNLQWNDYNGATAGTGAHQLGGYLYDFLAFYAPNTDEVFNCILSDYTVDDSGDQTVMELEFRDDYYWHNGDPVTAHDYATQVRLDMEYTKATNPDMDRPHVFIEEITDVEDHFARLKLHDNLSEKFASIRVIGDEQMIQKRDAGGDPRTYEEWLEALQNAEGSEAEDIAAELSEWRQEDPVGTGPWKVKEMTDSAVLLEVHEDHPAADTINFSNVEVVQVEDGPRAFLDGQVDAITARMPVPEDLQAQMPESVAEFNSEFYQCIHVAFNNGDTENYDPITADVNVRKAMAYILDHSVYETNTPVSYEGYYLPNSNIAPGTEDTLDFSLDDFTRYEPDEEMALQHLEEAGYTRENGQVVDSSGQQASVNIVAATGISDSFVIHGQTTASLLEQFGFDVTFESLDNAGFSERRFNGEYDIIPDLDGFNGPVADNNPSTWDGWYDDLMHLQDTYELPMPIGATGDEVETYEEFSVVEALSKWQESGNDEDFKKVAWWHNQLVPRTTPIVGPDAGRLNTTGNWRMDNSNRGLTQTRPGMKNAFRFDAEGARVYYEG